MNDEKRFCSKCGWNDCDYGCTCPSHEEVILNNLDRFSDNDEVRHRAMSGGGASD